MTASPTIAYQPKTVFHAEWNEARKEFQTWARYGRQAGGGSASFFDAA